jgi:uncharacterized membrane protein
MQFEIVCGFLFGQISGLAVWSALSFESVFVRGMYGLIAAVLVTSAFMCGLNYKLFPLILGLTPLAFWVCLQITLSFVRLVGGWRLVSASQQAETEKHAAQFGIKHLLIGMGFVAILAATTRRLYPELGFHVHTMKIIGVLAIMNGLFALPIVWAILRTRLMFVCLLSSLVCCVLISFAEDYLFAVIFGWDGNWKMNTVQYITTFVVLLTMRLRGSRLSRDEKGNEKKEMGKKGNGSQANFAEGCSN